MAQDWRLRRRNNFGSNLGVQETAESVGIMPAPDPKPTSRRSRSRRAADGIAVGGAAGASEATGALIGGAPSGLACSQASRDLPTCDPKATD
jgi:hypothetical protein